MSPWIYLLINVKLLKFTNLLKLISRNIGDHKEALAGAYEFNLTLLTTLAVISNVSEEGRSPDSDITQFKYLSLLSYIVCETQFN